MALAKNGGLVDEGRGGEERFDACGRDFFASREDDEFLLAAADGEEAVGVEVGEVAGVKPTVADDFGGGGLVLPIAEHDVGAAGEEFTVGGDADFDAGDRLADSAKAASAASGDCDYGRSFRQAVAGQQGQALVGVPGFNAGGDGAPPQKSISIWLPKAARRADGLSVVPELSTPSITRW